MVIKSLTITEDAYDTLKRLKYDEESFSDVILRIGKERGNAVHRYFGVLKCSEEEHAKRISELKERRAKADMEFLERQKKRGRST